MKVKGLQHGLYEIYWSSGGSSLAAVGYDAAGFNWMAPCNWISAGTTEWGGWSGVRAIKLLIKNDYSKPIKGIKGEGNKTPFTKEHFNLIEEDDN